MTEPPHSISFPARCTACHALAAFPFLAETIKGLAEHVRIGLRCRACNHEWFVDLRTTRDGLQKMQERLQSDD